MALEYDDPTYCTAIFDGQPVAFGWGRVLVRSGRLWLEVLEDWAKELESGFIDLVAISVDEELLSEHGEWVASGVMAALDPEGTRDFVYAVCPAESFDLGPGVIFTAAKTSALTDRVKN